MVLYLRANRKPFQQFFAHKRLIQFVIDGVTRYDKNFPIRTNGWKRFAWTI